jgi:hypothetical protein
LAVSIPISAACICALCEAMLGWLSSAECISCGKDWAKLSKVAEEGSIPASASAHNLRFDLVALMTDKSFIFIS